MENYRGIYYNNNKKQIFYEAGAHFKYKDLYDKLTEIYNKKNNINFGKPKLSILIFSPKNYCNFNDKIKDNKNKVIKKGNNSSNSKKKTRNKKITNNNYIDSESLDNNYKEINLNNIFRNSKDKSIDSKNYYQKNYIKNTTERLLNYKKKKQNPHNNSINEKYKQNYINTYVVSKDKQNIANIKYNAVNKSINKKKNNSNTNNTIYNYSYLDYENNYFKKNKKIKANNQNNKSTFNIGIYKYNLYDSIFLKNKIKNKLKLKQYKYNSFVKENSISKNSVSYTKIKEKSKNKYISSYDKNINGKYTKDTKKPQNHIKSINYASIYLGINKNKTPKHNIKNISNDKNTILLHESIYNIKKILNRHYNKKKYLKNGIIKNQTSYAKIKKNQLSLTKRLHNKEIFVKERLKRDT